MRSVDDLFREPIACPHDLQIMITFGPLGARLSSGVIYTESDLYGICDAGCDLRLLNTGQTITMKPDDHVVINHGVMKYED